MAKLASGHLIVHGNHSWAEHGGQVVEEASAELGVFVEQLSKRLQLQAQYHCSLRVYNDVRTRILLQHEADLPEEGALVQRGYEAWPLLIERHERHIGQRRRIRGGQ